MREFTILKVFRIQVHPPKAPSVKEVFWSPPLHPWIKVNTDGAATKNPLIASAGGIFRDHNGLSLGCFSQNLSPLNAFSAELMAAMLALENAQRLNINKLWLETDSHLITLAFTSTLMVPWSFRNRWLNCLVFVRSISFCVSHLYREGNACADSLATFGLSLPLDQFNWWDSFPSFVLREYTRNKLGMPNYRFVRC
jgi:ribonuclease HI